MLGPQIWYMHVHVTKVALTRFDNTYFHLFKFAPKGHFYSGFRNCKQHALPHLYILTHNIFVLLDNLM